MNISPFVINGQIRSRSKVYFCIVHNVETQHVSGIQSSSNNKHNHKLNMQDFNKQVIFLIGIILSSFSMVYITAQETYKNPILPGFNPDPSICRVNDDYYLVTSSWEYSPSVPIYHSKDLVNWEIINYVARRPEQINLTGYESYGGVWAPTIRHHKGIFYVTFSLVKRKVEEQGIASIKNILYTSEDIYGEWSAPNILTNSTLSGIDPALFFDESGKTYLLLNRTPEEEANKNPNTKIREICIQEFDLNSQKLIGKITTLTRGSSLTAHYAEGPRLIKKDGAYYLLISEGGTGFFHAVTISKSDNILGPYLQYIGNPILTHRHLGENYPYQYIGHADFIETQNGEWWAVVLGIRLTPDGNRSIMGRETFLCPMVWNKDKWPIISPQKGTVPVEAKRPNLPYHPVPTVAKTDSFAKQTLAPQWNFLRTPTSPFFTLKEGLIMKTLPEKITDAVSPAFVGQRITASDFLFETELKFHPNKNEEAGLVIISSNYENYRFVITKNKINLIGHLYSDSTYASAEISSKDTHYLRIISDNESFSFYYSNDQKTWEVVFENAHPNLLGFRHTTGDYVGMYTSANGNKSNNNAIFKWCTYDTEMALSPLVLKHDIINNL